MCCEPGNISGYFGFLFLRAPYKLQFFLLSYCIAVQSVVDTKNSGSPTICSDGGPISAIIEDYGSSAVRSIRWPVTIVEVSGSLLFYPADGYVNATHNRRGLWEPVVVPADGYVNATHKCTWSPALRPVDRSDADADRALEAEPLIRKKNPITRWWIVEWLPPSRGICRTHRGHIYIFSFIYVFI